MANWDITVYNGAALPMVGAAAALQTQLETLTTTTLIRFTGFVPAADSTYYPYAVYETS